LGAIRQNAQAQILRQVMLNERDRIFDLLPLDCLRGCLHETFMTQLTRRRLIDLARSWAAPTVGGFSVVIISPLAELTSPSGA
jgi:hypothetical protein